MFSHDIFESKSNKYSHYVDTYLLLQKEKRRTEVRQFPYCLLDLDGHLGPIAHDGDHAPAGDRAALRVVVLHAEHGVRIQDVPPVEDLTKREQHERATLVIEDGTGGEVVDFLTKRRNWLAPALAGPLLEELDHLRGVLVNLVGLQSERYDEEVEHLAALDGLLVLVHLAERVDENSIDSCDVHRRYFLSVGNMYTIA